MLRQVVTVDNVRNFNDKNGKNRIKTKKSVGIFSQYSSIHVNLCKEISK